jgi:chromosome segregation ATPase
VLQVDRVANGADGKATLLSTVSNASRELLPQVEQLQQDHAAMFQKVTALEERVESYVNVCTQLQADGTSMKESVKVLADRLHDTTAETESWQALVEELADHTRTLEEAVGTHEGVIDAHRSLLDTQDSTLQAHDATCRTLDSVTQRLQEKIELEVTKRLALEDVVAADRAKWTDILQQWQRELLGLKERHGEQPPVEEETELKRIKEEISAVQGTLASLHVRQKMQDDEMKMVSKRLEDRHDACTQQHVRVLRTIKAILESDA